MGWWLVNRRKTIGVRVAVAIMLGWLGLMTWHVRHDSTAAANGNGTVVGNRARPHHGAKAAKPTVTVRSADSPAAGRCKSPLDAAQAATTADEVYKLIFPLMERPAVKAMLARIFALGKNFAARSDAEKQELRELALSPEIREILELLRLAATKGPCNFNLDYSQGFALTLSHIMPMRNLSRLASNMALDANAQGDVKEACRMIRLGLQVANDTGRDETLISQLVQFACDRMTLDNLNTITSTSPLPEVLASGLMADIAKRDYATNMTATLARESAMAMLSFDKIAAGELPADGNFFLDKELLEKLRDPAYLAKNKAKYAEISSQLAELAALPYDDAVKVRLEKLKNDCNALPMEEYGIVRTVTPVFSTILKKMGEQDAAVNATLDNLAASIYRNKYGREPAGPGDLQEILDTAFHRAAP